MKIMSFSIKKALAGVLLLIISTGMPWAVAEDAAKVSISSNGIMFQSIAAGEGSTLRVSCTDGFYFEKVYSSTDSISFALPLVTGQCKYELRTHPLVDRESLAAAEAVGDEQLVRYISETAAQQVRVSNGTFQVTGGVITAPQKGVDGTGGVEQ